MVKAYVELSDYVKLTILDDNYLMFYAEYNYNVDLLTTLYCKLHPAGVSELTVIMHGMLYEKSCKDDYVSCKCLLDGKYYYSNLNKQDVDKMIKLAELVGVQKLKIVDKFGYYDLLSQPPMIVVDRCNNLCTIYVKTEQTCFITYATSAKLDEVLLVCVKKYKTTNVVNTTQDFVRDYVNQIINIKKIEPSKMVNVFVALSVVGYAESEKSTAFSLNIMATPENPAQGALFEGETDATIKEETNTTEEELLSPDDDPDLEDDESLFDVADTADGLDASLNLEAYEDALKNELEKSEIKEDMKKGKRHVNSKKKASKVVPQLAISALIFSLAFIGYSYSAVLKRQDTNYKKQISENSLKTETLAKYQESGTANTITESDVQIFNFFSELSVNGYYGEFQIGKDNDSALVYLYNALDADKILANVKKSYPNATMQKKRSFSITNGTLTSFKIRIPRDRKTGGEL